MANKQTAAIENVTVQTEAETTLSRMNIDEVDATLRQCDVSLKEVSSAIKELLEKGVQSIPADKLKQLRQINARKAKLIVRRITLLSQSADTGVKELLDQLLAIKPSAV
jgi:hypothetical protein